jgi:hypothetical protein
MAPAAETPTGVKSVNKSNIEPGDPGSRAATSENELCGNEETATNNQL